MFSLSTKIFFTIFIVSGVLSRRLTARVNKIEKELEESNNIEKENK